MDREIYQLTATTLARTDVLPTQAADGATEAGKNTIQNIADLLAVPKIYVAYLTQVGTAAPTAFVIKNTLGATVVWSRTSTGSYRGTLAAAFPTNNTAVYPQNNLMQFSGTTFNEVDTGTASADALIVNTFQGTNGAMVATDQILSGYLIKVEVYS